jgi:hypothetical protein
MHTGSYKNWMLHLIEGRTLNSIGPNTDFLEFKTKIDLFGSYFSSSFTSKYIRAAFYDKKTLFLAFKKVSNKKDRFSSGLTFFVALTQVFDKVHFQVFLESTCQPSFLTKSLVFNESL